MKKLQLLLLDAGPIIALYRLNLWEHIIERCEVSITRTIAEEEASYSPGENEDIKINLKPYQENEQIKIIDCDYAIAKNFLEKFDNNYQQIIDPGELESLAFMDSSNDNWTLCSADAGVFKVLGILGRTEQGISLEELLDKIGLSKKIDDWKYTKKFRLHYSKLGQQDSIQNRGLK